ncbi:PhnD/SsuA/transferrin family substrate-binding protein [Aeromonas sp. sif2416]|uniref:sensor histidine kinase n=1 Tax=Aeromonas sp. sif2416 TaxID=2854793 RepID=UPI001C4570E8|nr:PhnD/SsuA/transferrin family substrate-binding protein [Aeromonas sp. sif2416]MBV7438375.1 PhnD/SsuA/transferrin family substrate-binding protein [Aeromonas sp. sif2416]
MGRFILCASLLWLSWLGPTPAKEWQANLRPVIRIGVIAFDQPDSEKARWQPTVDYLNRRLPQYQFLLVSGDVRSLNQLVASATLDFVISNGLKFLDYQRQHDAVRLLSLSPLRGTAEQAVGSTLIGRADAPPVGDWQALRHKRIVATSPEAFGGFQIMQGLWLRAGLHPEEAFPNLVFAGLPQEDLLRHLAEGRAEVAILPTCILEQAIAQGRYDADQFVVIMPQPQSVLPCQSSTPLYPTLSLAKMAHVNEGFARDLAKVLLEIPTDSAAARAGHYRHWTVPVKDAAVIALQQQLDAANAQPLVVQVWYQYRGWLLIALGGLLLLGGYHLRVKYLIQLRTRQLKESNARLTRALTDNRLAAERLNQQQSQLFSAQRVLLSGELAAGMAHELNQPLMALNNYLAGCRLRLAAVPPALADVEQGLDLALAQVSQAKGIIARLRDFMRKGEVQDRLISLDELLRGTLPLFHDQFVRQRISLHLPQGEPVHLRIDPTLMQQVLVNLLCNASEAVALNPDTRPPSIAIRQRIEANRVTISIHDNGTGMTEAQRAHLFVPFHTSKKEGLGLGLVICKRIIESYGGTIWAEAVPQGAVIAFSLPLQPLEEGEQE